MQDFNEAITANAEDTAEATEEGYQAPNLDVDPNEDEAQHEEYRSTQLKNSNRKYAPKSDPTNLSEPRET